MNEIKKIDVHAHAVPFPQYTPTVNGARMVSIPELLKFYDDLNIEKGILLPLVPPESMYETVSPECCKYMVDQYPDRFDWFTYVDPRAINNTKDIDLSILLRPYKELGAKGVGELTANLYADDPKVDNLLSHCEELELPVIIHIAPTFDGYYGIVDELHLPRLEKMLQKHPDLKIIGHSQLFWSEISADVTSENRGGYPTGKVTDGRIAELLRKYPNLYCETSADSGSIALMRDTEYTAKFFEEFSHRVMYGCDICRVTNQHPYKFDAFLDKMLQDGMLTMENYKKIVRNNAIDILKLNMEKA